MTDYEIINWFNAYGKRIERIQFGFVLTYINLSGDEVVLIGEDFKDCVRKANNER